MKPDDRIVKLEQEIKKLQQEMVALREDVITINGSVAATTVQVNLRGIKRKITHAAP